MGFLTEGDTFVWEEVIESPMNIVKKQGILQFLSIYKKMKTRTKDRLLFGDEIEYIVVSIDKEKKQASLCLKGSDILEELEKAEDKENPVNLWRPEYARYMIEGTPGKPFGLEGILLGLTKIEASMRERRTTILKFLEENQRVVTLTNFPLLGAIEQGPFSDPPTEPKGPIANSQYASDLLIHPHKRFATLTKNIRTRRGSNVNINVPMYQEHRKGGNIHMDAMVFGMGCCCLQTTFQCCNIEEARHFYDQFAVISPILLALTAGAPIFRGYLSNVDARWNIISASVDDRTEEERGLKPLRNSKYVINKSRYDSIDCFISTDSSLKESYNDLNVVYDKEVYEFLLKNDIDHLLARHIAHLYIRDPLVIYRDKLLIDNETKSDHFENIQSTNWQTVRFKPPPPESPIGWRVEVRPMEIQLTDFENAAFVVFVVLLERIISNFDVNFYIPISKVDVNMATSQKINAVQNEKFYFRKYLKRGQSDEYELMTINEIINGKGEYSGLIPLIRVHLDTLNIEKTHGVETRNQIEKYLSFISKKASGELPTTATWIRKFVTSHPAYKNDCVITQEINYDLVELCNKIGRGEYHPEDLLGSFKNEKI